MDLAINKPFKNYFSDCWETWISSDNPHPLTKKARNFEKPTREQTITWISKAWTLISTNLAESSFNIYKSEPQESQNQEIEEESGDFEESEDDEDTTDTEEDDDFKPNYLDYVIEIDDENQEDL